MIDGGSIDTWRSADSAGGPQGALAERGPQLVRLLCADDLTRAPVRYLLAGCDEVTLARAQGRTPQLEGKLASLFFDDPYASSRHARLVREGGQWLLCDEGSTNGTLLDGVPLQRGERRRLGETGLLEVGHTFFHFRARAQASPDTPRVLDAGRAGAEEPQTLQLGWERELGRLEQLAATGHELLLQGESGAGKEVLARHLHARSGRRGPLVAVNCAAMATGLLDDELFGHVKGAFSGAAAERTGLLRAAHRGTLLLDEVGDMPAALQARLLRVLEDHRVRPLGSERELEVDVRVIAATHRDLGALVAEGTFRHDLLARLGLLPSRLPAVRERPEDLGLLVRAVLRSAGHDLRRVRFELTALRTLLLYSWPLNVRELRRALLAAIDLAKPGAGEAVLLLLEHLPAALRAGHASPAQPGAEGAPPPAARRALDPGEQALRDRIVELLGKHAGNVAAVARELGEARSRVQRRMARLGIARGARAGASRPGPKR